MNKNLFNREVRPLLTEIRIGKQGRAFDRLEMEAAAEEYMSRNGHPAAERSKPWDRTEGECQDSNDVVESGTSTRPFTERESGLREQEVVKLSWQWEVQVPELDSSIFVVPRRFVKNGLDRYVVLNRIARSVIDSCRGKHSERVFTRNGRPITKIYNSGWKGARRRASERYAKELGRLCPKGFQSLRVHDLKHTFGHRLRAAGIGFEDRKVLLGHKSDHVTTHHSAPEIGALIAAAERVCELGSRKSHALSLSASPASDCK